MVRICDFHVGTHHTSSQFLCKVKVHPWRRSTPWHIIWTWMTSENVSVCWIKSAYLLSCTNCTVRFILTNFTTFVKILCNLSHFYNDLDRRCNNVHIWKNLQHSGSNRRPLYLEADALPLSYGALIAEVMKLWKLSNFKPTPSSKSTIDLCQIFWNWSILFGKK